MCNVEGVLLKFEAISCGVEVLPYVYWLFEYCLNKCAHKFSFHFLIQSKKHKYNKHKKVF